MRDGLMILVAATALAAPQAATAALSISSKTTANVSCVSGVCTATAKKAVLNVSDLTGMLASGDVTVQSGSLAQDIEIDAQLTWASSSQLTLDSYRSITFNKAVTVAGPGVLTITTNDGGSGGGYAFVGKGHVKFWDAGGKLRINGAAYFLVGTMRDLVRAAKFKIPHNIALMRNIHAGRKTYNDAPIGHFLGALEGLGNTIYDLTISSNLDGTEFGLMREYSPGPPSAETIRDIRLENVHITGTGPEQRGGALVGHWFSGDIYNIHVSGSLALTGSGSEAGGIIGDAGGGTLRGCDSAATSSVGDTGSAGGLIGTLEGSVVDRCFASGAVSGGDGSKVGGLVGDNVGNSIANSYATGPVSGGNNSEAGGLVGANEGNFPPKITISYSTGTVTGGAGASVGGSIGADVADSVISDVYWDLDTSGISDPSQGAGNVANDHGITGLTDAQLKSTLPAGFDKHVWGQDAAINNGYPYLLSNPPQ